MSEKRGKKRPKSYYIKCAKKPRQYGGGRLDAGMRGFLVTCNKREKEAVREMYNLLNEYADQMYGREEVRNKSEKEAVREMYNLLNEYADQMYGREEVCNRQVCRSRGCVLNEYSLQLYVWCG